MLALISKIIVALLLIFLVSSFIGLVLAVIDIKKNKNGNLSFRKSRKKQIQEYDAVSNDSIDMSVLSDIANLSPNDQEIFRSELLKKFNGEV